MEHKHDHITDPDYVSFLGRFCVVLEMHKSRGHVIVAVLQSWHPVLETWVGAVIYHEPEGVSAV